MRKVATTGALTITLKGALAGAAPLGLMLASPRAAEEQN